MFDGRIISGITVFVAVADAGSYSRAAEHVRLSRSGVGKAIGRLEDRTGLRLFDRTSRTLKLTDEGRSFLAEVKPLLDRLGEAAAPAVPNEVRGHLRISCDAAFGTFLLMPILPQLVKRHPKLRVDVIVRDRIDNLSAEGIDVAVRFGEPRFDDLGKRLLLKSRVVTCASASYVERHGLPSHPKHISDGHTCILLTDDITGRPHSWGFVTADGDRNDIAPQCNIVVNDAPSLLAGIHSGHGIGRALDFMVDDDLRTGRLLEVLPEWNHRHWPAYIYMPLRAHVSPGVEAFTSFILSQHFDKLGEAH